MHLQLKFKMASLVALFVMGLSQTSYAEQSPNVLILYADDMGYGDLQIQNPKSKIPTPHLNRLAEQGVRFTDGHSSSGICTPSRYALLTGRHHWRDFHGIVNAFGQSVFKPERLTLPEMLKERGYATACIGKWHLGWDWEAIKKPGAKMLGDGPKKGYGPEAFDWSQPIPAGPLAHGFDHYFGDTVINFPPYTWIEDDKVVNVPDTIMDTSKWKPIKEGNWECRPGPMFSGWNPYDNIPTTTQRGVDYIHKQKESDKPFFLYFAFPAPHAPIIPNDRFDGKSQAGAFGDFVCEVDDAVGQLLHALEESGQADNTVVIFSADNGPEHYAYARDKNFDHWSAEPFRGLKRDIYEGGHHVPFVIKWPGLTKPGTISNALVSQIDIMATFADLLEFELPADAAEDSHSLLPHLKGETNEVRTTHVHNTAENKYALRHKDWLLVNTKNGYTSRIDKDWETKRNYPADDNGPVELYNLKDDIGQKHNVAKEHPELVKELQELLRKIQTDGGTRFGNSSSAPLSQQSDFHPQQDQLPVPPPKNAIVLFDGTAEHHFLSKSGGNIDWELVERALVSSRGETRSNHLVSKLHFRDADIHVEFMTSPKAHGNSGIYLHGNYELQIMDSFGKQDLTQQDCGALYGFAKPLVNAARKAGEWQVYDIRYRAPRRDASGKIVIEGSVTAWLNGQLVQDNTLFGEPKSTYHPFRYNTTPYLEEIWSQQKQTSVGPVFLQDHDSPARFRNVWVIPLDEFSKMYEPKSL